MIRRLIETDMSQGLENADEQRISFWLRECRTPDLLAQLAQLYPDMCKEMTTARPLLKHATDLDHSEIESALLNEEMIEKKLDREYWLPLRIIVE